MTDVHPTGSRLVSPGVVATLDLALATLVAVVSFALYPIVPALLITLMVSGALVALAGLVARRDAMGYIFQTLLILGLTFPLARTGWPFGIVPMVCLLFLWSRRVVRREFGMVRPLRDAPDGSAPDAGALDPFRELGDALIVGASALGLALAGHLLAAGPPLFGGATLGWLAPVSDAFSRYALVPFAALASVGLLLRNRWAYALAPTAFTLPLISVHPLGRAVLPLLVLWPTPLVAGGFARPPTRPWQMAAILLVPAIGLGLTLRLVPAGTCMRHARPLVLYGWHEEPFITGQTTIVDRAGFVWDAVKVTCLVCELAVHNRELLTQCLTARFSNDPRLGRSFSCPYDRLLRGTLGEDAIPPNQFEQIQRAGRLTLQCRTCARMGLAHLPR